MKKLMHYNVKILGPGASSFRLPNGNSIQVSSPDAADGIHLGVDCLNFYFHFFIFYNDENQVEQMLLLCVSI